MKKELKRFRPLVILSAAVFAGIPVLTSLLYIPDHSCVTAQTRRSTSRAGSVSPVVKVGTELRIRLRDGLSSDDSRVGDRFTATVVDPTQYEGAIVSGRVASIKKSGRVKGRTSMSLAFNSIELTNGRRGVMHGEVVRVYDSDSAGKVDEEGNVESGSRGKQTLKRGGIGAAAGAVIGGIVGGGKGAAIGLIVGGAAGAGSIAIDGSKELELEPGTEMLIRVTRR